MKLNLKDVTLVCIDTVHPCDTVLAFEHTLSLCSFPAVKLFTNIPAYPVPGVEIVHVGVNSFESYSRFCVKELDACIDTPFCLIIQHDGFVVNSAMWTDEFLNYDYIGAVWWHVGNRVGNGGFSLRSKKLLQIGKELNITEYNPEDKIICISQREAYENRGCKFAPFEIANKFSIENSHYQGQFGFHGFPAKNSIRLLS